MRKGFLLLAVASASLLSSCTASSGSVSTGAATSGGTVETEPGTTAVPAPLPRTFRLGLVPQGYELAFPEAQSSEISEETKTVLPSPDGELRPPTGVDVPKQEKKPALIQFLKPEGSGSEGQYAMLIKLVREGDATDDPFSSHHPAEEVVSGDVQATVVTRQVDGGYVLEAKVLGGPATPELGRVLLAVEVVY